MIKFPVFRFVNIYADQSQIEDIKNKFVIEKIKPLQNNIYSLQFKAIEIIVEKLLYGGLSPKYE